LEGTHAVARSLLDLKERTKKATAFGAEYLKHVHPRTGRIHARYFQVGGRAGRLACTGPNLQQVPREEAYRGCFRPPEGRVLVKADLSQIELCVVAEVSGDERMLAALNAGEDLHRLTAAALFGVPREAVTKEQRAFGKNMNFGTVYGQGVSGLLAQARTQGLPLDEAGARRFLDRFAAAWPRLARWRRHQMASHAPGVRTLSGRLRRMRPDEPGTHRANTPIQGSAADGYKAALAALWAARRTCPSGAPVLMVHDELVIECAAAEAPAAVEWVTEALERGMRRYLKRAPVRVDATVAPSWGGEG
jgi:DNA polymerase-1